MSIESIKDHAIVEVGFDVQTARRFEELGEKNMAQLVTNCQWEKENFFLLEGKR